MGQRFLLTVSCRKWLKVGSSGAKWAIAPFDTWTPIPNQNASTLESFRHSIDEKNRITIPSRWRRDRPEDFILLPEATQQFLLVMSPKEFRENEFGRGNER